MPDISNTGYNLARHAANLGNVTDKNHAKRIQDLAEQEAKLSKDIRVILDTIHDANGHLNISANLTQAKKDINEFRQKLISIWQEHLPEEEIPSYLTDTADKINQADLETILSKLEQLKTGKQNEYPQMMHILQMHSQIYTMAFEVNKEMLKGCIEEIMHVIRNPR